MAEGFTQKEGDGYRRKSEQMHRMHAELLGNPAYVAIYDHLCKMIGRLDTGWHLAPVEGFPHLQGQRAALDEFKRHWEAQCPGLAKNSEREVSAVSVGAATAPSAGDQG